MNKENEVTQDRLTQECLRFIRAKKLLEAGDRVLLAVSGGLDSTVLAHLLSRLTRMLDIEIEIAHIDHLTRGPASKTEGVWVRVLGEKLQVRTHLLQISKPQHSSQAELRNLRRSALLALATDVGANRIATAHHADDNAETFLIRAISGTGSRGLAGIAPSDQTWIRPLLSFTRMELEDYARKHRLGWVEDPSNARAQYLRNQIRHQVSPVLEEIRKGSIRNISRAAERIEEEERSWESWIEPQLEGPKETLSVGWLERWPVPLRRRIFRVWLTRLGLDPQPALIEYLVRGEELVHTQGSFLRRSDLIVFNREESFGDAWNEMKPLTLGTRLSMGRSMAWCYLPGAPERGRPIELRLYLNMRQPKRDDKSRLQLDWELVPWPLAIRSRNSNDPAVLDQILDQAEIPRPYQKSWPLVVSQENPQIVVAAVGVYVFDSYCLRELGRCVSLESFFEEGLRAHSET